jgi:hypothetical protein
MTTQILATPTGNAAIQRPAPSPTISPRRAARIAGIAYLVMFVVAILANFGVRERLIDPDNATATVANITGSMGIFRLGLLGFLTIFILDVLIAWALHIVFRRVNPDVSLATAWFRLVYAGFLGVAIVSLFNVLELLGGAEYASALGTDQINAHVMRGLGSFESTWLIGLVAFGVHLALLGTLLVRSGYAPKVLGIVLIAAGLAYALDTVAHGLLADYQSYAGGFTAAVAVPSMVGEGWLGIWLIRTRRLER